MTIMMTIIMIVGIEIEDSLTLSLTGNPIAKTG